MIRPIIKKDLLMFLDFCETKKIYSTFKNRKRIFNNCLKHGDKCFIKTVKDEILAVLIIYKSDNKRYLKLFSNDYKDTRHLFQYLQSQNLTNLYILAHKRDKHLLYFNRRTQELNISYIVKRVGFNIIKDLDKKYLLSNAKVK